MSTNKNAFIIRDFNDAGTEEKFVGGSVVPVSEGAFINYKGAGLVREATAAEVAAAKGEAKPKA
ncbi:hypothetical protein [Novosphingobium sp. AP12]|uniref:hypothetical protein n=1 Tax=Novosphingobium sp. AP12 TaxID=1144305 RepID=UPI000271FFBA|nr:hypothetical protein [Novosphingobium sp. AP12]EJL34121.1 hypothetical protein PMI02_00786 [Novosphingobium sp. AP12]